ncbi:ATP synthase subunit C [Halioxenophilus aromaticivorans]|uniref:V-ATPase proteolipid subunit C-like domain-containing protein n=1 Tax=Halioxenophilus aromaticivorans TaxID=1306992 RepID=A0AAV3U4P1_9ALTE
MNDVLLGLAWLGVFAPVALGAVGSVIGCALGGQAALGAMLDTEAGYGRFIGISVLPSTFVIYGIVLMFAFQAQARPETGVALAAIGSLAGVAFLLTASWQGRLCVAAINSVKEKPELFGLSITPIAIVEGFGVFVFIFALVLSGSLVTGGGAAL